MDLVKEFREKIMADENFLLAYDIVKRNSRGRVWLIGGMLCRGLSEILHGLKNEGCDFDFIVEEGIDSSDFDLPGGWSFLENKYGNPKLIGPNFEIDYVPLNSLSSIIRRKLEPTIENFLTGTPFTIQSMAYDFESGELVGDVGLKALKEKTFGFNDLEQAKIFAEKKGMSAEELLKKKAASMGFEAVL